MKHQTIDATNQTISNVNNYELDQLHDNNQRQCLDCQSVLSNSDIAADYELCEQCATLRWNDKQHQRELKQLASEQANDLKEPELQWWYTLNQLPTDSNAKTWDNEAQNKGYNQ